MFKQKILHFVLLYLIFVSSYSFAQLSNELNSAIRIYEAGRDTNLFSQKMQNETDINSIICIDFDSKIIQDIVSTGMIPPSDSQKEYIEKLKTLQKFLILIKNFSDAFSGPLTDKKSWDVLSEAGTNFYQSLFQYLNTIPDGKKIRDEYNHNLENGRSYAFAYINKYVKDEIVKLNELNPKDSLDRSNYTFQISGKLYSKDSERQLNIPGYYDANTDNPQEYQKVKFEVSKEEKDAVENQAQVYQNLITITANFNSFKQKFTDEIATLLDTFEKIKTNLSSFSDYDISKLPTNASLDPILKVVASSKDDTLLKIYNNFIQLITKSQNYSKTVQQTSQDFQSFLSSLKSSNDQNAADIMFTILDDLQNTATKIKHSLDSVSEIVSLSGTLLTEIKSLNDNDLQKISEEASKNLAGLPQVQELFSQLKNISLALSSINDLSSGITNNFIDLLLVKTNNDNAKSQVAVSAGLSPESLEKMHIRSQDELTNTVINMQEYKNRQDGDHIILKLVIKKDGKSISEQEYFIKIFSFGINSSLYTGLTFIRKSSEKEFYPSVAVSWMLKWWGRNDLKELWHSFGVGFHTTTLVVEKNNTQIGVGPAFHFANNLLQVGWGWNITSNLAPYWYIGFGLFELLKM